MKSALKRAGLIVLTISGVALWLWLAIPAIAGLFGVTSW